MSLNFGFSDRNLSFDKNHSQQQLEQEQDQEDKNNNNKNKKTIKNHPPHKQDNKIHGILILLQI